MVSRGQQSLFVALVVLFFLPSCISRSNKKSLIADNKVLVQSHGEKIWDQGLPGFGQLTVDEIRAMKNNIGAAEDAGDCLEVSHASVFASEYDAKWSDIPTCFEFVPVVHGSCENSRTVMLSYQSVSNQETVRLFYHAEMERCGWKEQFCFEGREIVLLFVKPKKSAIVIIRPVSTRSWWRSITYTDITVYLEK